MPKAAQLSYEDIRVGSVYEFSKIITKQDAMSFAELTGDYNPLHTDESYGRESEFGKNVVHGMLAASLFSTLVGMYCPGKKSLYLSQSVNFKKPLFYDDHITVRGEVLAKNDAVRIITLKTEVLKGTERVITGEAKIKVLGNE